MITISDTIERLANVPPSHYEKALAILFVNYAKMPTTNVPFSGDRMFLVAVINDNKESRGYVRTIHNEFENYLIDKFKPYADKIQQENVQSDYAVNQLNQLVKNFRIGTNDENNLFTIQDKFWRSGQTALRITLSLEKNDQQSISLTEDCLEQLSRPELEILEQAEQLSVCSNCPNLEQIMVTQKWREPKCSKCNNDTFTVRLYTLNPDFEKHKRNNKDLPLFIAKRINRRVKNSAITSKKIEDFETNEKGDIDVYIEKLNMGIETKLWVSETKPTDEQIRAYSNNVQNDLEKYSKVGIKKLVVVTNLEKEDAERMYQNLIQFNNDITSLKIIHRSIHELIRFTDEIIESMS